VSPHKPPAAATALLRFLLPGPVFDEFAGDLEERFHRVAESNPSAARRAYWKDVLSPTVLRFRREARGMPLPPGSSPRSGRGDGFVMSLITDLKFAIRMLLKAPTFTAIAVVSLALGIGPNTAIFSLVNAVLFQDWGVDDPEKIVDIYTLTDDGQYFFSRYSVFELVRDGAGDVFEDVAQHSMFTGRITDLSGDDELVLGAMATGNYFTVMGVQARLGRTFVPEEDAVLNTNPVVVISDRFWRTRHGSNPALVGGDIRLNGRPYSVIGIAPPEFRGRLAPGIGTDFWVPFSMYPHLAPGKMGQGDLTITGRLRDGVAPGEALAAVTTVATRYNAEQDAENPDRRSTLALIGVSLADVRLHPNFDQVLMGMAALLFVAVGLVLLIACVNLAGFLLSRAVDRRKEMAVRVAMGAGRGAIVRQLAVESLVLAGMGAALGLVLGQLAMRALVSVEPPVPIPIDLDAGLNVRLMLFTGGIAVLAALFFGLAPALEATRAPIAATLRDEAGSSGGKRKVGARGILVGAQMALSTVLIFGAALFLRSLQAAGDTELGFETRSAAVVTVETLANESTAEQRVAFLAEVERRLRANPAVEEFGVTGRMPLDLGNIIVTFDIPGVDPPPNSLHHRVEMTPVTPGHFSVMGIPLVEGRAFDDADRDGSQQVAILSRAAATLYWPGESAIGKVLFRGGDPEDVIVVAGVAGDVKIWSLGEPPRPHMYLPYHQGNAYANFFITVTGNAPPGELAALVRAESRAINPEIFLSDVGTMDDHLAYIFFLPRMAAVILSLVGVLALILACIGLYGMVSYGVSRRTREMGIRLALGADRQSVVGMVLKSGLTLVGVGGLIGLVICVGLGQAVEGFLLGVSGLDPLALLAAPVILSVVAAVATYLPARKASRVNPVSALRTE
jgi:predicted permease